MNDDGEVEVAGAQGGHGLRRLELGELQLHAGVGLPERRDGAGQEPAPGGREGSDAQGARVQAGEGVQGAARGRELGRDALAGDDQGAAGLREPHPARQALQHRRPGLALQRGDLLGERRGRVAERARRRGQRLVARDLGEQQQAAGIQHGRSVA